MYNVRQKGLFKTKWIGWPGMKPDTEEEEKEVAALLKQHDCVPVFLDADVVENYLYFHETVLRPLFHNFKGLSDFEHDLGKRELWQNYQFVNKKIASAVQEQKQDEKELVWIQDNYLLLVPSALRHKDRDASIGFFFHSPFPSSDVYKMFPYRSEVLKSLLSCDLIGFHLFEYARNFYTSCRRVLGINYDFKKGFLSLDYFGR